MKNLIVANWKMNPGTVKDAENLFDSLKKEIKEVKEVEAVVCPPFVYLSGLKSKADNVKIGGQNCFWEEKGAYTGEVSFLMLKDLGCSYVIVGHSERRKYFSETNETVNKKIKAVLKTGLNPIFCIGETQEERSAGKTEAILKQQIISGLGGIKDNEVSNGLAIAYEPVWAIGTGNPCDTAEAKKVKDFILGLISEVYGEAVSKKIRILYGGSVNGKNARSYIKEAELQGLLVGGASLDAEEFAEIVRSTI
ncbi:MAG: triose-phosphate isomerase [Candidatus Omnitrophica bacterium]|nr:triose-phosphate isomerase [Candidatus Omnitrophota bacterium]